MRQDKISQEQMQKEFEEAVEPAIKWLNENVHPHHTIIIEHVGAELLEGNMCHRTTEFLAD